MIVYINICHMFVNWCFINLFLTMNSECKHYSSFRRYKSRSFIKNKSHFVTWGNLVVRILPPFYFCPFVLNKQFKCGAHLVLN